jgi:hypothetical protein
MQRLELQDRGEFFDSPQFLSDDVRSNLRRKRKRESHSPFTYTRSGGRGNGGNRSCKAKQGGIRASR